MSWRTVSMDSVQYDYEYFQRDNVCRICWAPNASSEIMIDSENEAKCSLYEKIIYCLGIDIKEYSRINKLCYNCTNEINNFYDFKIFSHETNSRLQQIYQSSDESNDIDIKIEKNHNFNEEMSNDDIFINDKSFVPEAIINNTKNENVDTNMQSSTEDLTKVKIRKGQSRTNNSKHVSEKSNKLKNKTAGTETFCNACHIDYENEERYSEHNISYHGIEKNGTVFKCFGCEKRFKSKKTRASHELNFCKGLKDGYKCSVCERFLPKRKMHEKHMRYHLHNRQVDLPDDLFKCNKCYSRFKSNDCLTKHMREHDIKKIYICDTCGRVFTRQDYLYKHMLTHAGVKRHSCPHCDFKATQRSSLTMHIRKHTGERPYVCDLCPQRCVSSSNLRAHRRRHLHIKKYQCKICDKKFGYKISLDEHVSATHERTELHPCQHCSATYTRIRGLRRHLAAKHGKQDNQDSVKEKPSELENLNVPNDEVNKVDIMKNVRYELKEGDLVLIKNQDCDVFLV